MQTWQPNDRLPHVGLRWNRTCRWCHIPLLTGEDAGFCCGPGGRYLHVVLPLPPLPDEYNYFIHERNISSQSRKLNVLFSFAALRTTAQFPNTRDGFVAIRGKVYHQVRPNNRQSGMRWLLYDGYQRAAAPEHGWTDDIPELWTRALATALMRLNPLSQRLFSLSFLLPYIPTANITLLDNGTTPQIAAILRYDNSAAHEIEPRSLVIMPRHPEGQEVKISVPVVSRFWEPLAYPLLFPHGTLGWGVVGNRGEDDLRRQANFAPGNENVDIPTTQIWHYRRRLLGDDRFHLFGRLTNEYLVDMFSRNLETRLHYIRQNQERLRREDAALMADEGIEPSENVYLPASFLGSKAWSSEQVADALAIAATHAQPTFFITATCNQNWPEIASQLRRGQTYADVPLVVARVFAQKLSLLMKTLRNLFPNAGGVKYTIQVVEFQKRGLPHAHILIRYAADCTTPDAIDSSVSAELPDNDEDARLVRQFMIHGCGSYCRPEGRPCRFKYPKPVHMHTTIDDEGRVQYRRRSPQDAWVVPHNIQLLRLFRCHINVEVANTSHIFQYIFKYIHKGPDRTRFRVDDGDVVDEIEEYWAGRYLSAEEAAWRILGKKITRKSPAVTSLPIHVPGSNRHHQYARRAHQSKMSLLDRYFHRPIGWYYDDDGHPRTFASLRYTDYYRLFRHEALNGRQAGLDGRHFNERDIPPGERPFLVIQRDPANPHLTRIVSVRPSQGEVFYIRALLNYKPALSFEDLRTVNGEEFPTFQDAATALGLFADRREAEYALAEAIAALRTPRQLRVLFVHLLINDCCHNPLQLWDLFRDQFSLDFYGQNGLNLALAYDLTLDDLGRLLAEYGKSLEDYGLPVPRVYTREVAAEMARWNAHPDQLAERAADAVLRMNAEQHDIYEEIVDAAMHDRPLCMFIDGKAGRGKTFLLNALCDFLRSQNRIVIPTATSAFAAQLYPGGRTAHSAFKIPVNEFSEMLESPIGANHSRGELLEATSLFVWDEAPMAHRAAIACAEDLLRRITENDALFGGKVMIFVGDFRQTCPVIRGGTARQVVDASIRSWPLWNQIDIRRLTIPIRNARDPDYAAFVDAIGDGAGPDVPLPDFVHLTDTHADLINFTFPAHILQDPESSVRRSILAPTNAQVDAYNDLILQRMPGEERMYLAADSIKETEDVDGLPPEACAAILDYVARRPPPGLPAHSLTVKVGAVYRLMRNLSRDRGLVKNIRGVVECVGRRIVTLRILREEGILPDEDSTVLLPRIPFEQRLHSGHTLVRRQFPIAPAYATTFNSCQGLTLDRVGVDTTRPVFSHGQLYTALSRVRGRDDILLRVVPGARSILNITYNDILL